MDKQLTTAVYKNDRPELSSERAPHNKERPAVLWRKIPWKRKKNLSQVPDGDRIQEETSRLTVVRKITSTLILVLVFEDGFTIVFNGVASDFQNFVCFK
jgi:hypothetical protein